MVIIIYFHFLIYIYIKRECEKEILNKPSKESLNLSENSSNSNVSRAEKISLADKIFLFVDLVNSFAVAVK